MRTSIFILEDNMTQIKTLTRYIHNYAPDIELCIASSKEEAFILLKNHPDFNAYLLDVSLGSADLDTDGLAVANYIIDSHTTTAAGNRNIIFITAFPEHIYTAVNDIHCTAYLLKPYTQKDLYAQLDAIFHTEYALQLKTLEGIYAKLNFAEIYYIESHARYMYFHTTQGIIKSRQYRLKELTTLLPSFFIQCHKSYIINSKYIDFVSPGQHFIQLKTIGEQIPYGNRYYSVTQEQIR